MTTPLEVHRGELRTVMTNAGYFSSVLYTMANGHQSRLEWRSEEGRGRVDMYSSDAVPPAKGAECLVNVWDREGQPSRSRALLLASEFRQHGFRSRVTNRKESIVVAFVPNYTIVTNPPSEPERQIGQSGRASLTER